MEVDKLRLRLNKTSKSHLETLIDYEFERHGISIEPLEVFLFQANKLLPRDYSTHIKLTRRSREGNGPLLRLHHTLNVMDSPLKAPSNRRG